MKAGISCTSELELLAPADTHPWSLLLAFATEEIQSAAMSLLQ